MTQKNKPSQVTPYQLLEDVEILELYKHGTIEEISAIAVDEPDLGNRYKAALAKLHARKNDEFKRIEERLIVELVAVGVRVTSVYDLINTRERYDKAIPVLLRHLNENYHQRVREGIARSLARPWARETAWTVVLQAYLNEPNMERFAPLNDVGALSGPKDGMAVALSEMARATDLDQLIQLIETRANGPSRIFFVKNLSKSKPHRAFETLAKLSRDPDLEKEIAFRMKEKLRRQAKKDGSKSAKQ